LRAWRPPWLNWWMPANRAIRISRSSGTAPGNRSGRVRHSSRMARVAGQAQAERYGSLQSTALGAWDPPRTKLGAATVGGCGGTQHPLFAPVRHQADRVEVRSNRGPQRPCTEHVWGGPSRTDEPSRHGIAANGPLASSLVPVDPAASLRPSRKASPRVPRGGYLLSGCPSANVRHARIAKS